MEKKIAAMIFSMNQQRLKKIVILELKKQKNVTNHSNTIN